jgi:hypothetical protein
VSNYGPPPFAGGKENVNWPNLARGVLDAAEADIHKSFGTVAMVADPNGIGPDPNTAKGIAFYAFGRADADGNQPLIRSVALDGEGPKTVPGMCMTCHSGGDHGGGYNHADSFLPFDVQSFSFDSTVFDGTGRYGPSGFDLDNQQEAFRQLNALVMKASAPAIQNLINGLYAGNVNTPGASVPDDGYIPAGWDIDKASRNLYRHVYRPYCRTCHVAQRYDLNLDWDLSFQRFSDFDHNHERMLSALCGTHAMPNAEVPYGAFIAGDINTPKFSGLWTNGVAQSDLHNYFLANGMGSCF